MDTNPQGLLEQLEKLMAATRAASDPDVLCQQVASAVAEMVGGAVLLWAHGGEGTPLHGCAHGLKLGTASNQPPAAIVDAVSSGAVALEEPAARVGLEGETRVSLRCASVADPDGVWSWVGTTAEDVPRGLVEVVAEHLHLTFRALEVDRAHRDTAIRAQTLIEQLPAAVYYRHPDQPGRAFYMSPQLVDILGYEASELVENPNFFYEHLHPDDREMTIAEQREFTRSDAAEPRTFTYRMIHKDGHVVWIMNNVLAARSDDGKSKLVVGVLFDVTKTKELESQLSHAQKMDALGRLAGGVAHDFNNLLTIVLGYGALLSDALASQPDLHADVTEVIRAGERGKALVQQLLAFGRKPLGTPGPVDLSAALGSIRSMFGRLLRNDIEFVYACAEDIGSTRIDPGQFEQVIMNLLINALDVMPGGGTLRLDGRRTRLDHVFKALGGDLPPGDYAVVAVSDTGGGMDAETRRRMFEPFFTTKPVGKGSGLGLATAHGIVTRAGGCLWVYSEQGRGTTIKVFLPRLQTSQRQPEPATADVPRGGTESILLVEDDPALRRLTVKLLEELGYAVTAVADGEAALNALDVGRPFDLVLSDVIMPAMSGVELLRRVRAMCPNTPGLLMSGYEGDTLMYHRATSLDVLLLPKPFTVDELDRLVRLTLDGQVDA